MSFFVVLVVYLLYRKGEGWHRLQRRVWLGNWWNITGDKGTAASRIIYLAIPLGGLFFAYWLLSPMGMMGSLALVLIDLFVLVQILGEQSLRAHFDDYREQLAAGEMMEVGARAAKDLGYDSPTDSEGAYKLVWQALARRAFIDFFTILFWYWLGESFFGLGALFAMAWRLIFIGAAHDKWFFKLRHMAGWVPARLALLGYAFVGNFSTTLPVLMHSLTDFHIRTSRLLCDGAKAALVVDNDAQDEGEKPFERLFQLVQNTELVWLAAFSLLAIAGA